MSGETGICKTCDGDIYCRAYSHHWKHYLPSLDEDHRPFPKTK